MLTSVSVPARLVAQTESPLRAISPVFRGLVFALLIEFLMAAAACAAWLGFQSVLRR